LNQKTSITDEMMAGLPPELHDKAETGSNTFALMDSLARVLYHAFKELSLQDRQKMIDHASGDALLKLGASRNFLPFPDETEDEFRSRVIATLAINGRVTKSGVEALIEAWFDLTHEFNIHEPYKDAILFGDEPFFGTFPFGEANGLLELVLNINDFPANTLSVDEDFEVGGEFAGGTDVTYQQFASSGEFRVVGDGTRKYATYNGTFPLAGTDASNMTRLHIKFQTSETDLAFGVEIYGYVSGESPTTAEWIEIKEFNLTPHAGQGSGESEWKEVDVSLSISDTLIITNLRLFFNTTIGSLHFITLDFMQIASRSTNIDRLYYMMERRGKALGVRLITGYFMPPGGDEWTNEFLRYQRILTLTESSGIARDNEVVTLPVTGLASGKCYHDSIRVYDDDYQDGGSPIVSQTWDKVNDAEDGDFNFTNEADWAQPSGVNWSVTEVGTAQEVRILPRYMGFSKVLEVKDGNSGGAHYSRYDYNMADQPYGEISFIYRCNSASALTHRYMLYVLDGAAGPAFIVTLNFSTNKFSYYDGVGFNDTTIDFAIDTWYYIRVEFRCTGAGAFRGLTADKWKLHVTPLSTGVEESTGELGINGSNANIGQFNFTTDNDFIGSHYIAAVDCSWFGGWYQDRICYLMDFKLSWLDSVAASSSVDRYIYYVPSSQGDPGYSGLSRSTNQVTCSDGTQYSFNASSATYFQSDSIDKNALNWDLNSPYVQTLPAFSSAADILWLEDNAIFVECIHRTGANEYIINTIYDNNLIKKRIKNALLYYIAFFHSNADAGNFADWRYHVGGGWAERLLGSGTKDQTLDFGKCFYDDTTNLEIIYPVVWLGDANSLRCSSYMPVNTNVISPGNQAATDYLQANTEYTFWTGLLDVGSTVTGDKEDYVDDLYTILIDAPLSQSLGAESETYGWTVEGTLSEVTTGVNVGIHRLKMVLTGDEARLDFPTFDPTEELHSLISFWIETNAVSQYLESVTFIDVSENEAVVNVNREMPVGDAERWTVNIFQPDTVDTGFDWTQIWAMNFTFDDINYTVYVDGLHFRKLES